MKKILRSVLDLPLYTKIFIGFALGAVWGIIFNVPADKLDITYIDKDNRRIVETVDWELLKVWDSKDAFSEFTSDERNLLLEHFLSLSKSRRNIKIEVYHFNQMVFTSEQTIRIEKVKTWATKIKWIGNIFMRLLSFLAIPLVLSSLIVGAASLEDIRKLEKIGVRAFLLYVATTIAAITIGLTVANVIQPGNRINQETKEQLLTEYQSTPTENLEINFTEYIENIVPRNPFRAIASEEMLQIVFFAVFLGVAINYVPKEKTQVLVGFFSGFSEVMIKMVDIVMKIAPIGVFSFISATI